MQYKNPHNWARKVGFGFEPDAKLPSDLKKWNQNQLNDTFSPVGISERSSKPVAWPTEFIFSLEDRLKKAEAYHTPYTKLQKSKNMSKTVRNVKRTSMQGESFLTNFDVHRYWSSAIYGEDMVQQRLTHFWMNHFFVSSSFDTHWVLGDLRDRTIYSNLNSSFDKMLYEVTTHIGMLDYLDNVSNFGEKSKSARKNNGKFQIGLNDNLGRELLELHTVSVKRGYSETDIRNTARVLAGWGTGFKINTLYKNYPKRRSSYGLPNFSKFALEPYSKRAAEPGSKTILGQKFPAGKKALRKLTDMLASDDYTVRHLSRKLAFHFLGERATNDEIKIIYDAWKKSKGDLKVVHKVVLEVLQNTHAKKFLWPNTWMFQAIRISGADMMPGFFTKKKMELKDIRQKHLHDFPLTALREIGFDLYEHDAQPDGFSDKKEDWVSTEHFDRRVKMASKIFSASPKRSGEEIAEILDFSDQTKRAISMGGNDRAKFIIALCSPDFMEV